MRYFKTTITFIIFNMLISLFTLPVLLSLSPFQPLRNLAMQTIVETRRGPKVLAFFMSKDAIAKLRKDAMPVDNNEGNTTGIKIDTKKRDNSIKVIKGETSRFTYYVMLVSDPTRVKVAVSKSINETGERVSDMARRLNVIGAVNGGGFQDIGWQGNGGIPLGVTMSDGKAISTQYDPSTYVIGLDNLGALHIGKFDYNEVKRLNIKNSVSFPGPVLIRNGQALNAGNSGMNPRTAIGQKNDGSGTIIMLVVDGRSFKSQGATYKDLQDIMFQYGAYNAVNLDGGSSTTMYYDGDVINNPGNLMGERYVPTSFVVMP